MSYFFIAPEKIIADKLVLEGREYRHIAKVLRLKPGDTLKLMDGASRHWHAKITALGKNRLEAEILSQSPVGAEPAHRVILYQGLIKGEKFEGLIARVVELGISRIVPILTSRTVVRLPGVEKQKRWKLIAQDAACMAGRGIIPEISPPLTYQAALNVIPQEESLLLFWENSHHQNLTVTSLKTALAVTPAAKCWHIFVGPEGGFDEPEVQAAQSQGGAIINLGPRILKAETAGITAVALTLHELGELAPAF